ncbi:MAG: T9SS type A sorting domain-containing protein [Flavobacteriales bacterium]|nr:T9SS type A sorting domain-containing protein [Bacteroidota bacterium]MCB9241565.1 T9SS type A sorting domain-containing protein [Flavobacteriales bacterium]
MIRTSFNLLLSILVCLGLFTASDARADLSGSYTIDAKSAASKTNYQSFTALMLDLSKGQRTDGGTINGPAMSGMVLVTVVKGSGPYNESVLIPWIEGSSPTNRIIIDGNNETILSTAADDLAPIGVKLDEAQHVELHNIKFQYDDIKGGKNLQISHASKDIIIENCEFTQTKNQAITAGTAYIALTMDHLAFSYNDGIPGDSIQILNNIMGNGRLTGVDHAIYLGFEQTDTQNHQVVIRNNTIEDYKNAAIEGYYLRQLVAVGNTFQNNFTTSGISTMPRAINMRNTEHVVQHRIDSNLIQKVKHLQTFTINQIEIQALNAAAYSLRLRRNTIKFPNSDGPVMGIYGYMYGARLLGVVDVSGNDIDISYYGNAGACTGIQIYLGAAKGEADAILSNNKVSIVNTSVTGYGIYFYTNQASASGERHVINNIVSIRGTGNMYGLYIAGATNDIFRIYHNTLSTDDQDGKTISTRSRTLLSVAGGSADVINNIFYAKIEAGNVSGMYFQGPGFDVDYNCVHFEATNGANTFYASGGSPGTVTTFADFATKYSSGNDYDDDPQFADLAKNDFTPTGSSVLDKGLAVSWVQSDINGITRDAQHPDPGAIEVQTSNVPLPAKVLQPEFGIYPNPATDKLLLLRAETDQDWRIVMYDARGLPVQETIMSKKAEWEVWDLIDLPSGTYFIRGGFGDTLHTRKLVIIH